MTPNFSFPKERLADMFETVFYSPLGSQTKLLWMS